MDAKEREVKKIEDYVMPKYEHAVMPTWNGLEPKQKGDLLTHLKELEGNCE